MKAMFGGEPSGGFFDLPMAKPGDTADADIILMGAPAATPYPSVGNYCATAPDAIRTAFAGQVSWGTTISISTAF